MPWFLDSHTAPDGITLEDLAAAHARDVEVQAKHGVKYVKYWYDAARGRVFCLAFAPTREEALAVHQEANGIQPDDIFEVQEFE
jgi:Protein of unknown function (DUF4242)